MVLAETWIERLDKPSGLCLEAKTLMFVYNKQDRGAMSVDVSEGIREINSILERGWKP